jgi:hypothetical protein
LFAVSNAKGAETSIYLACSPDVEGVTGKTPVSARRSSAVSHDQNAAAQLWDEREVTGLAAD